MKKKLGIVVPTANRPKVIENWIKEIIDDATNCGVDIIIYDSSNDDETEKICNKFQEYVCLAYRRYSGIFDGVSLDHKIIQAYIEFADDYDYLWLIRDGLIPKINMFYEKLSEFMNEGIPCIIIDALYRNYYIEKEIHYQSRSKDYEKLLIEQAHRLQTLGMQIYSSDFALDLIEKIPLNESVYSLWQMAAPLHYYAKYDVEIVFYIGDTFTFNKKSEKGHFWQNGEKLFEQWGVRWCRVIDNLPEEYGNSRQQIYKVYTFDFHPFSPQALVDLRLYGGLSKKMFNKYKKYFLKTSNTPLWFVHLVILMPKKFWKKLRKNKKKLGYRLLGTIYMISIKKEPVEGVIKFW